MRTIDPVFSRGRTRGHKTESSTYKIAQATHRNLLSGKVIQPLTLASFKNSDYKLTGRGFVEIIEKCPLSLEDWGIILGIDNFPKVFKKINYFPSLHTEKIFETLLLCNLGNKVYGDEEDFKRWLNQPPIPYFGNRSPKELLSYSSGFTELYEALQMIDYGQTA